MKIKAAGVLLLMLSLLRLEGQVADSQKYVSLDPYYFHLQYLKEDPAILIDVRLPFEYRGKIIRDAINIPSSREMKNLTDTITKDHALFLYCTTDDRSRRAAELLYDQGFRKLYNLEGGIVAWKKENMPVTKGRKRRRGERREKDEGTERRNDLETFDTELLLSRKLSGPCYFVLYSV